CTDESRWQPRRVWQRETGRPHRSRRQPRRVWQRETGRPCTDESRRQPRRGWQRENGRPCTDFGGRMMKIEEKINDTKKMLAAGKITTERAADILAGAGF